MLSVSDGPRFYYSAFTKHTSHIAIDLPPNGLFTLSEQYVLSKNINGLRERSCKVFVENLTQGNCKARFMKL